MLQKSLPHGVRSTHHGFCVHRSTPCAVSTPGILCAHCAHKIPSGLTEQGVGAHKLPSVWTSVFAHTFPGVQTRKGGSVHTIRVHWGGGGWLSTQKPRTSAGWADVSIISFRRGGGMLILSKIVMIMALQRAIGLAATHRYVRMATQFPLKTYKPIFSELVMKRALQGAIG